MKDAKAKRHIKRKIRKAFVVLKNKAESDVVFVVKYKTITEVKANNQNWTISQDECKMVSEMYEKVLSADMEFIRRKVIVVILYCQ